MPAQPSPTQAPQSPLPDPAHTLPSASNTHVGSTPNGTATANGSSPPHRPWLPLAIFITLIALISLASTAYLLYFRPQTTTSVTDTSFPGNPLPTSTPPPHADPTADWQTYNSKLGYSIDYPSNWYASPDPGIGHGDILY